MSKYTKPCECCGQPVPREPTLQERAEDVIRAAISEVLDKCWHSADAWPGSNSVMRHIMNSLARAEIGFVSAAKEARDADD